jgi:peptidoglycan hydrolase-like protein with peptidoglycan-binding domain
MKNKIMKKIFIGFISVLVLAYTLSVPTGIGNAQSLASTYHELVVFQEGNYAIVNWTNQSQPQKQVLEISLDQENWYPLSWTSLFGDPLSGAPLSGKGSALDGVRANDFSNWVNAETTVYGLKDNVTYYYKVVSDGTDITNLNVNIVNRFVKAIWPDQSLESSQELKVSLDGTDWTTLSSMPLDGHSNALDGAYIVKDSTFGVNVFGLTDDVTYRFKVVVDGSDATLVESVTPDPIQVFYHVMLSQGEMGGPAFYSQGMKKPGVAQPPTPPTIDDCDFIGWYYQNPGYDFNLPGSKTNIYFIPWDMNTTISLPTTYILALYDFTMAESGDSGITIRSNANVLNGATSLSVTPESLSDATKNVSASDSSKYVVKNAFSIDLFNVDNEKVEPNAEIGRVKVNIPSNIVSTLGTDLKNATIVFIAEDGKVTEMPTTINADGTISFTTTHFSTYALAKKTTPVVSPTTVTPTPVTSTTPSQTLPVPTGVFKAGSKGAAVTQIQAIIGVKADGVFGAKTKAALKAWQKAHGLKADGIFGPKTQAAMTKGSLSTSSITVMLKSGSSGTPVKQLQTILGLKVDGIFGPKTKAALIAWQKAHGLKADGILGPKTIAAMNK